jgi:glycosyltransferase involved in cell wall biosynthesis
MHLIGLKLKKKNPSLRWIADFRDPWSEWGLLDSLMVGSMARARHRELEKKVLKLADEVTTITPFYERRFSSLAGRPVKLFTNGFDADDFKNISYKKTDKFILRHVGIINEKCDPRPLMSAMHALMNEDQKFASHVQIEFIGEVHGQFRIYVEENISLRSVTKFSGNIPHKELISEYGSSSLLMLVLHGYKDAEGYMPGKLFEYIATGIPVLGVGPTNGDASDLLLRTQTGKMFDAKDQSGIISFIKDNFQRWNDVETPAYTVMGADVYSRQKITERLTELLNSLT